MTAGRRRGRKMKGRMGEGMNGRSSFAGASDFERRSRLRPTKSEDERRGKYESVIYCLTLRLIIMYCNILQLHMRQKIVFGIMFCTLISTNLLSQQVADTAFNPVILQPEYAVGKGPVVAIDEGHSNFHTADGRYLPFARLLRSDGYVVSGYSGRFRASKLKDAGILVIANALNKINVVNWYLPTPSAFTAREIETVRKWIERGGSLFLIADHMPFGGAAENLAAAFGFRFTNGFAIDTATRGQAFFYRNDGSMLSCPLTNGRNSNETISKVVTFTGQAFQIPEGAKSVLKFDERYLLLEPDTAWVFDESTRFTPINGWSQGAFMKYGKGRIVMSGEAAMFSAQLGGPSQTRMGMNSDIAEENYKFLLNIIHWLDGRIRE
jgi:hypothetical protein